MMNKWKKFFVITLAFVFSFNLPAQKRFVLPDVLFENSGLVITGPDSLWWINDGNNPSVLYLTNRLGEIGHEIQLPVTNHDWEDLALDDAGNFLIGDFGNNRRRRQDLCIYRYHPAEKKLDTLRFSFPHSSDSDTDRSWNHNTEAMIWYRGKIHLFTKGDMRSKEYICHHYTLDPSLPDQTAVLVESVQPNRSVITSAALSPDRSTLALLAYKYHRVLGRIPDSQAYIHFYKISPGDDLFFNKASYTYVVPTWLAAGQYESIDFMDSGQIIISAEGNNKMKPFMRRLNVKIKFKE